MKTNRIAQTQKSQVLIFVVVSLAVILAVGAALLFHSRSASDISGHQVDTERAKALAETGISIGEKFIIDNSCGDDLNQTYATGGGNLLVEVDGNVVDSKVTANIDSTASHGNSRRILEKTITLPDSIDGWAKAYGSADYDTMKGNRVLQIAEGGGGYLIGGRSKPIGPVLIHLSPSDGSINWVRQYSGVGYLKDFQQTRDGGYILLGEKWGTFGSADLCLIKTAQDGTIEWSKVYGGSSNDFVQSVSEDLLQDNDFIISGHTTSFGPSAASGKYSVFLVKIDGNDDTGLGKGKPVWAKAYGDSSNHDYSYWGVATNDGGISGYATGGYTKSFGYSTEMLFIKTDDSGNVDGVVPPSTGWAKLYGEIGTDVSTCGQLIDSGYIIGGYSTAYGFGLGVDAIFIRTDIDGNVGSSFPGTGSRMYGMSGTDKFFTLQEVSDGYLLGGRCGADKDFLFLKIDNQGVLQIQKSYGGDYEEIARGVIETPGGYVLAGDTKSFGYGDPDTGKPDYFVVKTDASGDLDCCGIVKPVSFATNNPGDNFRMRNHAPISGPEEFTLTIMNATVGVTGGGYDLEYDNFTPNFSEPVPDDDDFTSICPYSSGQIF